MRPKSSAWPLVGFMVVLVLYASLYPFRGWRMPGVEPWAFLWAPWPRYWDRFDVVANTLGYVVLGFGFALAWLRSDGRLRTWWLAWGVPALLSLIVEALQSFLPMRVPSRLDWALNSAGALVGASLVWAIAAWGGWERWSRWRAHWLHPQARGSLVLLGLWPVALLFPTSLPFGLGHVRVWWDPSPVEAAVATSAETSAAWWAALPLSPVWQSVVVALALLVPVWMAVADVRSVLRRLVVVGLLLGVGTGVMTLSSALTYGPEHGWAWVTPAAVPGAGAALVLALALIGIGRRGAHALMVVALLVLLALLNRAPASAYLAQSLAIWEQGRFVRFYGLAQWLGWLWPYAALWLGVRSLMRHDHRAS